MDTTLDQVFSDEIIAGYRLRVECEHLRRRIAVLTARGTGPGMRTGRAWRAALEAYLDAAASVSILDDDLAARLRGIDPDGFRGARAECLTAWWFAGRLGLPLRSRPPGRGRKQLELAVRSDHVEFMVEVKAPHVELYGAPGAPYAWGGDDGQVLAECLSSANRQFNAGVINVLVVVPHLRTPVTIDRDQLTGAFIGHPVLIVPAQADAPCVESFVPDGRLARPDGNRRRFTRTSAIVCIEEGVVDRGGPYAWVEHRALVVHNPFAQRPLPDNVFNSCPQLVRRGDHMHWTDRPPVTEAHRAC